MPDADDELLTFLTANSAPEFMDAVTFRDDGLVEFDVELERKLAYQQAPSERVDWAATLARPMAMGQGGAPTVTAVGWRGIPSTYVVCTEDGSILPESQRTWAKERATDSVEKPWDHCPQVSHPEETAELLAALARA
jgi:pimeloyl-ACP methyl ester carboxylesterase